MYITTTLPTSEGAVYLQLVYMYSHYTTILAPNVDCSPCRFYFSMYIETKIIMQGLVYATRSDGPHQQVTNSHTAAAKICVYSGSQNVQFTTGTPESIIDITRR